MPKSEYIELENTPKRANIRHFEEIFDDFERCVYIYVYYCADCILYFCDVCV